MRRTWPWEAREQAGGAQDMRVLRGFENLRQGLCWSSRVRTRLRELSVLDELETFSAAVKGGGRDGYDAAHVIPVWKVV